jgi:hypothetical protein
MPLQINNLNTASSLSIYLSINNKIKAISLNNNTMMDLLDFYKEKLNSYTGNLVQYSDRYGYKKEREELYVYENIDNLAKIKGYISNISNNNPFNISRDRLEDLSFYVVKIVLNESNNLLIFKKYQTIKRFYGTKPLFFQDTTFVEQDRTKFLLFETNGIDFFVYDNKAYIDSTFFFQAITNENATDFSKAREVITNLNDIIPIENIDALVADMESNNKVKRALLNISNNLDVISNITIDSVRNVINELGLNVEISADNKIIYDSKYRDEILDIFQDNYLTSQTTQSDYRTNSKIKITTSP